LNTHNARILLLCILLVLKAAVCAQTLPNFVSKVWVADNGDGTYKNPIIHADYSDPDVVRVGDDFYMTASSFNAVPGLPILHSNDLVNWRIINHVFREQEPVDIFKRPQHGGGVWAPSIRYHDGEFYIFYPDPDVGIYMTKAKDPAGQWSKPLLIKEAKGWIDPCPLWDDDGNAYLVHAWARSRSGIKHRLTVRPMSPDATKLIGEGKTVFEDPERKLLIAADHLLGHISSNPLIVRPRDGSERPQALVTYMDSLRKTREMDLDLILPGHGDPFTDHRGLIDQRFEMHRRRAEKIYGLIEERPQTAHELAQALWGNIAVTQAYLTLSEVLGHTDLLVNDGRVTEVDDNGVARFSTVS
jgi:hypothetical protein